MLHDRYCKINCDRRKIAERFKDEIYKWRLLSHYLGVVFENAEMLNSWLQDRDNNLLTSISFGSTYDGIIRGDRNNSSLIKEGSSLFTSIDNYQKIRQHPLFQWENQKNEHKTISDRDIATYLFLQNPLKYMPYPSDVFAKVAKDVGLSDMTMPRWMELGKIVLLPMLAEKLSSMPINDVNILKNLDVERDFIDIQAGKYLSMLDVQDFVYTSWQEDASARNYWSGGCSWGGESKVQEFVNGNYWQIGWKRDEDSKGAKQAWNNLKEVKIGDYLAFHGLGGRNDLKIYHLAEVVDKSEKDGKLFLQTLKNIPLYQGKSPKLASGSWFGTLLQINGPQAIQTIFGVKNGTTQEMAMNELMPFEKSNLELLKNTHQIILTGAPGTGKTYMAKQLAYALTGDDAQNHPHIEFCQFHPSLDYTDFVEGLRPISSPDSKEIGFERKNGIFNTIIP